MNPAADLIFVDDDWLTAQHLSGGFVEPPLFDALFRVLHNKRDFQSVVRSLRADFGLDEYWGASNGKEAVRACYDSFDGREELYPDGFLQSAEFRFNELYAKETIAKAIWGGKKNWSEFFRVFAFYGIVFHRSMKHVDSSHMQNFLEVQRGARKAGHRYFMVDKSLYLEIHPDSIVEDLADLLSQLKQGSFVQQKRQSMPNVLQYKGLLKAMADNPAISETELAGRFCNGDIGLLQKQKQRLKAHGLLL